MTGKDIEIFPLLISSLKETRDNLRGLTLAILPYVLGLVVLALGDFAFQQFSVTRVVTIVFAAISWALYLLMVLSALKYLFERRGENLKVTPSVLFRYGLATLFLALVIGVVAGLPYLLAMAVQQMAIAGVVVVVLTAMVIILSIFTPIFILKYDQGPVESISSSVGLITYDKNTFLRAAFILILAFVAMTAADYLVEQLFLPLENVVLVWLLMPVYTLLTFMFSLPIYAVWVQLYEALTVMQEGTN